MHADLASTQCGNTSSKCHFLLVHLAVSRLQSSHLPDFHTCQQPVSRLASTGRSNKDQGGGPPTAPWGWAAGAKALTINSEAQQSQSLQVGMHGRPGRDLRFLVPDCQLRDVLLCAHVRNVRAGGRRPPDRTVNRCVDSHADRTGPVRSHHKSPLRSGPPLLLALPCWPWPTTFASRQNRLSSGQATASALRSIPPHRSAASASASAHPHPRCLASYWQPDDLRAPTSTRLIHSLLLPAGGGLRVQQKRQPPARVPAGTKESIDSRW